VVHGGRSRGGEGMSEGEGEGVFQGNHKWTGFGEYGKDLLPAKQRPRTMSTIVQLTL
jgi:hypothetical protein